MAKTGERRVQALGYRNRARRLVLTRALFFVISSCVGLSAYCSADEDRSATQVVTKLQTTLLDVMKNATALGYQGRYAKLRPVVLETHDFDYIVRSMLGASAKELSEAQRREAASVFAETSTSTYAREFDGYSGERFEVLNEKPVPRGNRAVQTAMHSPTGSSVHFDYVLHEVGGAWRIINTLADGVSQLAIDRSQAPVVLKEQGFEGLLRWMRRDTPPDAS